MTFLKSYLLLSFPEWKPIREGYKKIKKEEKKRNTQIIKNTMVAEYLVYEKENI